jgi:predicted GNAT family acetyltransferase
MAVTVATFTPPFVEPGYQPQRLGPADAPDLLDLYAAFPESVFRAETVTTGCYYGIRVDGRLVAAGGTHVVTPEYGVAVIGSIFTHPDARGRGYATQVTGAITADRLRQGCRGVTLNVFTRNAPAIKVCQ